MDKESLLRLAWSGKIKDFADGISAAFSRRSRGNEMAKRSENKGRGPLADEILHYLINQKQSQATETNPGDTVEGIVGWWLPIQRIRYAVSEVEAALRELVAKKLVIARKAPDGRVHYRMNPKNKRAILRRLKTKTEASLKSAGRPSKAQEDT
jgi:hypothetical protein